MASRNDNCAEESSLGYTTGLSAIQPDAISSIKAYPAKRVGISTSLFTIYGASNSLLNMFPTDPDTLLRHPYPY